MHPQSMGWLRNPHCCEAVNQRTGQARHALTCHVRIGKLFHRNRKLCWVEMASLTHVHHPSAMRQSLYYTRLHDISRIAQYRTTYGNKLPERSTRGNDRLSGILPELCNAWRVEAASKIAPLAL